MLSREEAMALQKTIHHEAPKAHVNLEREVWPDLYSYYLVVEQYGKPRFAIRDEHQWQERKWILLAQGYPSFA